MTLPLVQFIPARNVLCLLKTRLFVFEATTELCRMGFRSTQKSGKSWCGLCSELCPSNLIKVQWPFVYVFFFYFIVLQYAIAQMCLFCFPKAIIIVMVTCCLLAWGEFSALFATSLINKGHHEWLVLPFLWFHEWKILLDTLWEVYLPCSEESIVYVGEGPSLRPHPLTSWDTRTPTRGSLQAKIFKCIHLWIVMNYLFFWNKLFVSLLRG